MSIQAAFQKSGNNVDSVIRSLYPQLVVTSQEASVPIADVASQGVAVSDGLFIEQIPPEGTKRFFAARHVPHTILGQLDRVGAIITRHEDKSSHMSIVCRSKGVPVVSLSEEAYGDEGEPASSFRYFV